MYNLVKCITIVFEFNSNKIYLKAEMYILELRTSKSCR